PGTSKETELKLTNVARASLEELLKDYLDFLRVRGSQEWPRNPAYAQRLRKLNRTPGTSYATFRKGIEQPDPTIAANVIAGLIRVTYYLLERQIRQSEREFLKEEGIRERMTRARKTRRNEYSRRHTLRSLRSLTSLHAFNNSNLGNFSPNS